MKMNVCYNVRLGNSMVTNNNTKHMLKSLL